MGKRFKLGKWVVYLLRTIAILSFLVMMSEYQDTKIFIISHLVAMILFIVSVIILEKNNKESDK